MEIKQSTFVTIVFTLFTIVFVVALVRIEITQRLYSDLLSDPSLVRLEMALVFLALPASLLYFTLSSVRRIVIEPQSICINRLFSQSELSENQMSWISSGRGWLYIEDTTGKHISFKIHFFHKSLNSRQVSALELAINEMKTRVQSRFPNPTATIHIKGVLGRTAPFLFAILVILLVPMEIAIWRSNIALGDAILVGSIIPLAMLVGFAISIYSVGTLLDAHLSYDSIVLNYPLRCIALSRVAPNADSFTLKNGIVSNKDGQIYRLRSLTVIGYEKLAQLQTKWFDS